MLKNVSNNILNGIVLFLFPLILTIYCIERSMELVRYLIHPIKDLLPRHQILGIGMFSFFVFLIIISICYAIGRLTQHKRFKPWIKQMNEILGVIIPTYQIINSQTNELANLTEENSRAVLINENENWLIGIEIEKISTDFSTIYLPSPPDGKIGKIRIIPISKIKPLEIPLKDVQRILTKYGKGLII